MTSLDGPQLEGAQTFKDVIFPSQSHMSCPGQTLLSSFDRLPVELVIEVFEQCLNSYPRLAAKDAPLLFCSISSSWRRVALSTPKLWTRFALNISDHATGSHTEDKNGMEALRLWLERSRSSPISFRVSQDLKEQIPSALSVQVLAELIAHSHRWSDAAFEMSSCDASVLQHILPGNLLALKSLSFILKGWTQSPFEIQGSAIPWDQLTALNFSFDYEQLMTLDQCFGILAQCGNLLRCTVNADCVFRSHSSTGRVTLPRLQSFELSLQSGPGFDVQSATSSLVSFLQQLELPRLSLFGLYWLVRRNENIHTPRWSPETQSKFTQILSSLAPTLRSLCMAYLPLSDQDLIGCMQQVQQLSHLDLRFSLADKEGDPITGAFLRASTRSAENTPSRYLPLLESLYIQTRSAHCTAAQITDLIESRLRPASGEAKLRSFGLVSLMPIVTPQAQEKLRTWAREGLDMTMEQVRIR